MDLELSGRVALVTGAGRGLGWAMARALCSEGVTVVGTARASDAIAAISHLGNGSFGIPFDARDADSAPSLIDEVVERVGRLDVLINNAGIARAAPLQEQSNDVLREVLEVNLLSPIALATAATRALRSSDAGRIVNVASIAGVRAQPAAGAYSASKAGLVRVTEALASELAADGIRVNAVALGSFETDMQGPLLNHDDLYAKRVRRIPVGRMGRPDEVGPLVCYLASRRSDFVTGATFVMDGGESSRI